jgi:DNA (cytosine-5)-methyltransferase 1
MKLLSLFSGIGAFEKALDKLGIPYELVAFCEIDKYAAKSYQAIHGVPESMNLGDITKVDEKQLPKDIDLITYGFPCQDISVCGRQKGLFNEDGSQTRSGLFFEALRIIEETQPRVAIAENVKNLTGKKFAEQFKLVLESLEQAGYNNYWKVLNAKDFGVPQNRERVFIVSIRKDIDNGTFRFPEGFPLELRLKDVLEDEVDERFYLSTGELNYMQHENPKYGNRWNFANRATDERAGCLTANIHRGVPYNVLIENDASVMKVGNLNSSQDGVVVSPDGISPCHTAGHGNTPKVLVSEPAVNK